MIKIIIFCIVIFLIYNKKNLIEKHTDKIRYTPDIVCLIAVYGRHKILKYNIELLKKQTKKVHILTIVSNEVDRRFVENLGVDYVFCKNKPILILNLL